MEELKTDNKENQNKPEMLASKGKQIKPELLAGNLSVHSSNEPIQSVLHNERKINVTDITSYLFCKRKFYLTKIMNIKEPLNEFMMRGMIKHRIYDIFSRSENEIVKSINKQIPFQEIIERYKLRILSILNYVFDKNPDAEKFKIDRHDFAISFWREAKREAMIRAKAISLLLEQGIIGEDLWKRLEPKYITELKIESKEMIGRIDRLEISKEKITPYEVKNRQEVYNSDLMQLTAYAMLASEHYNKEIKKGYIELQQGSREIDITNEMIFQVKNLINEIKNLKTIPAFPSNLKKCEKCSLKEKCFEAA